MEVFVDATAYPCKKSGCFYKLIVPSVWIEHDTWDDEYTVYPNRGIEVEYESGRTATKQLSVSRED